jgi:hypothetical protein
MTPPLPAAGSAVQLQPLTPYLHPALVPVRSFSAALAPRRPDWTPRGRLRLVELITRGAPDALRSIARHDPVHRWYTRLALTDEVEVWLLGWTPVQGTRPHDHGGASGAFTVLDGALAETHRDGPVRSRRVLLPAGGRSAFGPERVHLVHNPGPGDATSVHAYSRPLLPLGERSSVDPQ